MECFRMSLDSQGQEDHRTSSGSNSSGGREGEDSSSFNPNTAPRPNIASYFGPASQTMDAQVQGNVIVNPNIGHTISPQSPMQAAGGEPFQLAPFSASQQTQRMSQESAASPPLPFSKRDLKKLLKEEEKHRKKEEERQKKEEKKAKKEAKKKNKQQEMMDLGWCRPPMPVPEEVTVSDENPYYTEPRPFKDHLEELKQMLRESEICDCGLKTIDAELADGWTVHRSREPNTYNRVFYQHENGNTTWQFPDPIGRLLNFSQVSLLFTVFFPQSISNSYTIFGV